MNASRKGEGGGEQHGDPFSSVSPTENVCEGYFTPRLQLRDRAAIDSYRYSDLQALEAMYAQAVRVVCVRMCVTSRDTQTMRLQDFRETRVTARR